MDRDQLNALRKRAEERLADESNHLKEEADNALHGALHELRTHQVELEMQNEELRRVQEELVETRDQYVDLYDFAPVGFLTVDANNRIVEANLTMADLLGKERKSLHGQPFSLFIFHDDQDIFHKHFRALVTSTNRRGFELRVRGKDGELFWAKLECVSKGKSDWSGIRIQIALHDISEAKRLETEIIKAKKLEATALFAGGIAHDFNNLLAVILGNLEMALDEIPPDLPVGKKLLDAQRAVLSAANLTRKFLTFSSGGEPSKKTVSIAALLAESAGLALAGSNVDFECQIPDDLWHVEVDCVQMAQAFGNVLANAREAMPQGGTVRLRAENVDPAAEKISKSPDGAQEAKFVRITIEDRGVGIPEDVLPQVFDPYFSSKKMGKEKGMGLGMAITFSILKKHGGSIDIASRQNVGTTVTIQLPADDREIVEQKAKPPKAPPCNKRILVMDDEEMLRRVTQAMLEKLGYEVAVACDGEEAIQQFSKAKESGLPFGLVILDLTIKGGMGGLETLERLKGLDPDVKAIVASGYSCDPVLANFQKYGFVDALEKPYQLRNLEKVLGETADL